MIEYEKKLNQWIDKIKIIEQEKELIIKWMNGWMDG